MVDSLSEGHLKAVFSVQNSGLRLVEIGSSSVAALPILARVF